MVPKVPSSSWLLIVKSKDHISEKEKKKIERMNHAFGHTHWNVQEFEKNLSLNASRLDVHCDISTNIVSKDELVTFLGRDRPLMARRSNHVILLNVEDCEEILNL